MSLLQSARHGRCIAIKSCLEQSIRVKDELGELGMMAFAQGVFKLLVNLLVWYKRLGRLSIVGQVPKVDEERQHIIAVAHCHHVVGKTAHFNTHALPPKHRHDVLSQTLEVEVNVGTQSLIALSGRPEALNRALHHGAHDRTWVIHVASVQKITVVPGAYGGEIPPPFAAQGFDLTLGEPNVFLQRLRVGHRSLLEHVENRVRSILLDG